MNILYGLTYRNLKMNKRRTMVTIIGVILSTLLISVVAILATSIYDSSVKNEKERKGNYQVRIHDVTKEDSILIRNYREVKESFSLGEIGTSLLDRNLLDESSAYALFKGYIKIVGYNENFLNNYPLSLVKGRYPSNDREVLITDSFLKALKEPYQIGDKITLKVGTRVDKEGKHLSFRDRIYSISYDNSGHSNYIMKDLIKEEEIIDSEIIEYVIVGIAETEDFTYDDPHYYLFTYSNEKKEYEDLFLTYHNPDKAEMITEELTKGKYETSFNSFLLELLTISFGDNMSAALGGIVGVLLFVIIISSVLVIRNAFRISVVERTKQFGLLSSVGATSKQIRRSVLFEGFLIGLIATPIGVLLGVLVSYLLILTTNTILSGTLDFLELSVSWLSILIALLPSIVTIFFSCWAPALFASRMAPVEAIRNNHEIKIAKKQLKTPWFISKLFGIGGEVSYKNLKRSKKKYQTTVLSLIVSIIVFITLSSFIDMVFYVLLGYYDNQISCDLTVGTSFYDKEMEKEEVETKLKEIESTILEIEGIERYAVERRDYLSTNDYSLFNPNYYEYYERVYRDLEEFDFSIQISTVGNQEFKRFVSSLGGKMEDYEEGAILIDKVSLEYQKKFHEMNLLNVKEGDTLTLYNASLNSSREIKIVKRTDKKPLSIPDGITKGDRIYFIVSDSYMKKLSLGTPQIEIYINTKNTKPIIEEIEKINGGSNLLTYYDYQSEERMEKSVQLLVFIVSYGFIGVITLIGVTNIFNTITTNMILRRREFAMFRAVGMTQKEFHKMIRLESIFYGLKSLIIGITVALILTYYMNSSLSKWIQKSYEFPILTVGISIIFVFIVVYMTMHYSIKQINKQNIIETIREENI